MKQRDENLQIATKGKKQTTESQMTSLRRTTMKILLAMDRQRLRIVAREVRAYQRARGESRARCRRELNSRVEFTMKKKETKRRRERREEKENRTERGAGSPRFCDYWFYATVANCKLPVGGCNFIHLRFTSWSKHSGALSCQ